MTASRPSDRLFDGWERAWTGRDPAAFGPLCTDDVHYEDPLLAVPLAGPAAIAKRAQSVWSAFPDLRLTIEVLLEGHRRAAARYVVEATHTGPFGEIPPTGMRVRVTGEAIIRVSNRQIVEEHANADALGLLLQLGVAPGTVTVPPLLF